MRNAACLGVWRGVGVYFGLWYEMGRPPFLRWMMGTRLEILDRYRTKESPREYVKLWRHVEGVENDDMI